MSLLGNLLDIRRDVLQVLTDSAHRFGDIVRFRLGPHIGHLLNHPDYIEHVLQHNSQNYDKCTRSAIIVKTVCGNGLLSSNGELWRRQRRIMQPAFHRDRIRSLASVMTEATTTMLKRWEQYAEASEPLDVASEMMRLTCTIAGQALLGSDLSDDTDRIDQAMNIVLEHTWHRFERLFDFGSLFPILQNRSYRKAIDTLDEIIYRIIDERRRTQGGNDLLSMLFQARDEQTGEAIDDKQIRDETITMLLAGHETTANALARTFYMLSQFPEIEQQLRAELMDVLGGRIPTVQDVPNLKYTTMLISETLRLYPSIWIIERRAISEDEIGGYHIPARSSVVISPYALHRHQAFWEDPDQFDPERFTPARWTERQKSAYLPFGNGRHQCIGKDFAMMEARLIVAMVAQIFHLQLVPGHPVVSKPGITLGLRHGLLMTVSH